MKLTLIFQGFLHIWSTSSPNFEKRKAVSVHTFLRGIWIWPQILSKIILKNRPFHRGVGFLCQFPTNKMTAMRRESFWNTSPKVFTIGKNVGFFICFTILLPVTPYHTGNAMCLQQYEVSAHSILDFSGRGPNSQNLDPFSGRVNGKEIWYKNSLNHLK